MDASSNPAPQTEQVAELFRRARACVNSMLSGVDDAEQAGDTPAFCETLNLEGLENLVGRYKIEVTITAKGSELSISHDHHE
ncbi:MAG: hypothetical protein EKK59_10135 [Neisseriaceae bacterium]|nr:MAG: hypothetical protein EKK59_10135 [Neisseriaceae bacterium]